MKRFFAILLIVVALFAGGYYLLFQSTFILPFLAASDVQVSFKANGQALERATDGGWEEFRLRGVEISPAVPGHPVCDYVATYDDYSRWLGQIADMGSNAVIVTQLMDDEFYNALLHHNENSASPLYLVQGIMAESEYEEATENAYESGLKDRLIKQGKIIVDSVHGRHDEITSSIGGTGSYRSDLSGWTAGFLIVDQFDSDNVALTDHSYTHTGSFEGEYFHTTSDATAFEAMLAQVMDELTGYESKKYGQQRPIGFTCDALSDFLVYDDVYAMQLRKYVCVNAEHVVTSDADMAGRLAAYRLGDIVDNFQDYLSEQTKTELESYLSALDASSPDAYLDLVRAYHSMPVFGFFSSSSARGVSAMGESGLTEREQGEALRDVSDSLTRARWNGEFISSWQDVWSRRTWNTAFATMIDTTYLWHDVQTVTQCEGLLAFDPGNERVCVVDGSTGEWDESDIVQRNGDLTISARYDAEGLYLLIEGASSESKVYVPLDVSPEVGTTACEDPTVTFEDKADFLLCLDGKYRSRLLVQERYDATREMFLSDIEGEDPYVNVPDADTKDFVVSTMATSSSTLVSEFSLETNELRRSGAWPTGKLTHGNADPTADDYNSLADFCFGDNCVEVRIPWLLINVGDAGNMQAHRDYYKQYGVDFSPIQHIGMGVATDSVDQSIALADFPVSGWLKVDVTERLKQSYDVMRDAWQGGDAQ